MHDASRFRHTAADDAGGADHDVTAERLGQRLVLSAPVLDRQGCAHLTSQVSDPDQRLGCVVAFDGKDQEVRRCHLARIGHGAKVADCPMSPQSLDDEAPGANRVHVGLPSHQGHRYPGFRQVPAEDAPQRPCANNHRVHRTSLRAAIDEARLRLANPTHPPAANSNTRAGPRQITAGRRSPPRRWPLPAPPNAPPGRMRATRRCRSESSPLATAPTRTIPVVVSRQ